MQPTLIKKIFPSSVIGFALALCACGIGNEAHHTPEPQAEASATPTPWWQNCAKEGKYAYAKEEKCIDLTSKDFKIAANGDISLQLLANGSPKSWHIYLTNIMDKKESDEQEVGGTCFSEHPSLFSSKLKKVSGDCEYEIIDHKSCMFEIKVRSTKPENCKAIFSVTTVSNKITKSIEFNFQSESEE